MPLASPPALFNCSRQAAHIPRLQGGETTCPLFTNLPTLGADEAECAAGGDVRRNALKAIREVPFIGLFEDLKDVARVRERERRR